jgi:dynactin complex subunit
MTMFDPPAVGLLEAAITERVDRNKGLPLVIQHAFAEAKGIERRTVAERDSLKKQVKENWEELRVTHEELENTRRELKETRKELEDTRKQLELLRLSSGA